MFVELLLHLFSGNCMKYTPDKLISSGIRDIASK